MQKDVVVESLERRELLAFTLYSGFQQQAQFRLFTEVATSMQFAPDGRLFLSDNRTGNVRVATRDAAGNYKLSTTVFADVAAANYRERGLESLAIDPDFANNGYVYVFYSVQKPGTTLFNSGPTTNRLSRFKASTTNPAIADAAFGEQILLDGISSQYGDHNGGAMHFGTDGMLYLATGDGGGDNRVKAQDLSSLNGKVLRLDVRDGMPLVPADNPFVNTPNVRGEIYAYGFRNPFTGDVNPDNGKLYINDVGSFTWEEINNVQRGRSHGWALKEGPSNDPAHVPPIYAYNHNGGGAAITGGGFYAGNQFPASWRGTYFFADHVNDWIRLYRPNGQIEVFSTGTIKFLDFDTGPDGMLYGLEVGGNVYRWKWVGQANRAPTAVATADQTSGLAPLTVAFSGAQSSDPDGDALTYSWNFGDGETATGRDVSHTFDDDGTYNVVLTVNDGNNHSDASDPLVITVGNRLPSINLTAPTITTTYAGGQTVNFAATADDPEDGELPDSAFHWTILLGHNIHTHPFESFDNVSSGSFVIPRIGEVDPDQFYRVIVDVTDSGGLTQRVTRDIEPRRSTFTVNSNVSGAMFTIDGSPFTSSRATTGVVGMTRELGAPLTQTVAGQQYEFVSWSDGGAATHNINTPSTNTTYTATFRLVNQGTRDLRAVADAYVQNGAANNTNFGQNVELQAKQGGSTYTRESYFKFDLTGVTTITSAVLRLTGKLKISEAAGLKIGVFSSSNTTWTESAIKYSNKPATSATALANVTLTSVNPNTFELNVTNYVKQQFAAGKRQVTLALKAMTTTTTYAVFDSDESATAANRPVLRLTPGAAAALAATPRSNLFSAARVDIDDRVLAVDSRLI